MKQGLYLSPAYGVVYVAYQPVDAYWMYRRLHIGATISVYSDMRRFNPDSIFAHNLKLLVEGHLPNSSIPSAIYPELFI